MKHVLESAVSGLARALREGSMLGGDLVAGCGWVDAVVTGEPVPGAGDPMTVQVLGRRRHLDQTVATFFPKGAARVEIRYDGSLAGLVAWRASAAGRADGAMVHLVDRVNRVTAPGAGHGGHPAVAPYLRARLRLEADLETQLSRMRKRQVRSRLRKIARDERLRTTATRDRAQLERFHRELYAPNAVSRFGSRAHVDTEAVLSHLLAHSGTLLLVHRGEALLGGALVYTPTFEPRTLFWAKLGLSHCEELSPADRSDITAALELAVLRHAVESGAETLDLGLCTASLEDGVLVHKLRLGADLEPDPAGPRLEVALDPVAAPGVACAAPFLVERGGRLFAVVGAGCDGEPPEWDRFAATLRDRLFPSLAGVEVRLPARLATADIAAWLAASLGDGAPPLTVVAAPALAV